MRIFISKANQNSIKHYFQRAGTKEMKIFYDLRNQELRLSSLVHNDHLVVDMKSSEDKIRTVVLLESSKSGIERFVASDHSLVLYTNKPPLRGSNEPQRIDRVLYYKDLQADYYISNKSIYAELSGD